MATARPASHCSPPSSPSAGRCPATCAGCSSNRYPHRVGFFRDEAAAPLRLLDRYGLRADFRCASNTAVGEPAETTAVYAARRESTGFVRENRGLGRILLGSIAHKVCVTEQDAASPS